MKRYLVTAATPFEMEAYGQYAGEDGSMRLVTGVGPVECCVRLTRSLMTSTGGIRGVVNFGVAGAYFQPRGESSPSLLDICLARQEVFGDFGICMERHVEDLAGNHLGATKTFVLDTELRRQAAAVLRRHGIVTRSGTFVTVCCASGTLRRGAMLADRYQALCENMEGAAVARVCAEFGLPCLEIRSVSNMVEDRDIGKWKLDQACEAAGRATALVVAALEENTL